MGTLYLRHGVTRDCFGNLSGFWVSGSRFCVWDLLFEIIGCSGFLGLLGLTGFCFGVGDWLARWIWVSG